MPHDRRSLLIIRDMMLQGASIYKTFLECYEGTAANILADRLRKLVAYGIITTKPDTSDVRKIIYLLTRTGIDLASTHPGVGPLTALAFELVIGTPEVKVEPSPLSMKTRTGARA
jgi:hypothetical protein